MNYYCNIAVRRANVILRSMSRNIVFKIKKGRLCANESSGPLAKYSEMWTAIPSIYLQSSPPWVIWFCNFQEHTVPTDSPFPFWITYIRSFLKDCLTELLIYYAKWGFPWIPWILYIGGTSQLPLLSWILWKQRAGSEILDLITILPQNQKDSGPLDIYFSLLLL